MAASVENLLYTKFRIFAPDDQILFLVARMELKPFNTVDNRWSLGELKIHCWCRLIHLFF